MALGVLLKVNKFCVVLCPPPTNHRLLPSPMLFPFLCLLIEHYIWLFRYSVTNTRAPGSVFLYKYTRANRMNRSSRMHPHLIGLSMVSISFRVFSSCQLVFGASARIVVCGESYSDWMDMITHTSRVPL